MIEQIQRMISMVAQLNDRQELMNRRLIALANGHCVNLGGTRMLTETRAGLRMLIDGRDTGSGLEILHSGYIEPEVMAVLQRGFVPGSVFLDVGANFGFYTMLAAQQMGSSGQVFSFEANPNLIPYLEGSIYINGLRDRVTLINKAVADAAGTARFGFSYAHIGGGSLMLGSDGAENNEFVEVPLITVDAELPSDLVADVIKLDVEGHEAAALRGMRQLVARSPKVQIILEFFTGMQGKSGSETIIDLLEEMGLRYWKIGHRGRLHQVSREELVNGGDCYLVAAREKPFDEGLELKPVALRMVGQPTGNGMLTAAPGGVLIHGPYWYLPQGRYEVTIEGAINGKLHAAATHEFGFELNSGIIDNSNPTFTFDTNADLRYFEIVLRAVDRDSAVGIERIVVRDVS
jgi:FkbM family methyltransferase